MLEITSLRVNHQLLGEELRTHFCTVRGLSFSWGVRSGVVDDRQCMTEEQLRDSPGIQTLSLLRPARGAGPPPERKEVL